MPRPTSFVLFCLALTACGGPSVADIEVPPFTAEHRPAFENGVDMVTEPEALGGTWLRSWEQDLDQRITQADVVALVQVRAVRHNSTPNHEDTLALLTTVDRIYVGEETMIDTEELVLTSTQEDLGYDTVRTNERRILDNHFFVFVKWERTGPETLVPHWHLSPATGDVAERARALLTSRRQVARENQGTRTIVVHQNEEQRDD